MRRGATTRIHNGVKLVTFARFHSNPLHDSPLYQNYFMKNGTSGQLLRKSMRSLRLQLEGVSGGMRTDSCTYNKADKDIDPTCFRIKCDASQFRSTGGQHHHGISDLSSPLQLLRTRYETCLGLPAIVEKIATLEFRCNSSPIANACMY